MATILLGTVALEPNRWGAIDRSRRSTIDLGSMMPAIAGAGFDGIELWENHRFDGVAATVFNTYVSLDDDEDDSRTAVADAVTATGAAGVKFNVGGRPELEHAYADRAGRWLDDLPPATALLCECHAGTIAEEPAVAASILERAGPPSRVRAIVHTHEDDELLRRRFDAYGDRIAHVHVNFLDTAARHVPALADVRDTLEARVALLHAHGFDGTWTIEFVHGTLTERDEPSRLLDQAVEDLAVLRDVLA